MNINNLIVSCSLMIDTYVCKQLLLEKKILHLTEIFLDKKSGSINLYCLICQYNISEYLKYGKNGVLSNFKSN